MIFGRPIQSFCDQRRACQNGHFMLPSLPTTLTGVTIAFCYIEYIEKPALRLKIVSLHFQNMRLVQMDDKLKLCVRLCLTEMLKTSGGLWK